MKPSNAIIKLFSCEAQAKNPSGTRAAAAGSHYAELQYLTKQKMNAQLRAAAKVQAELDRIDLIAFRAADAKAKAAPAPQQKKMTVAEAKAQAKAEAAAAEAKAEADGELAAAAEKQTKNSSGSSRYPGCPGSMGRM